MTIDYAEHVRRDTARMVELATGADWSAPVPSCPDWTFADLLWHLTEVQSFWGAIVSQLLDDPGGLQEPPRPPDAGLAAALSVAGDRLVAALGAHEPATPCWTWSDDKSVGFVLRRQAHEALIHRVDAELAMGVPSDVDPTLAADGIDELLSTFVGGTPEWADFTRDGTTMSLVATDTGNTWGVEFGRFTGTSPNTGKSHDFDHADLAAVSDPDALVSGSAAYLDLWLWGRANVDGLHCSGDQAVAARLRTIAADVTV